MNTKSIETPTPETNPKESQPSRPWVTPSFERVPLNEALNWIWAGTDAVGQES
jgi:hypothetical protein